MNTILLLSHSQKSGGAERCLLEAAIGLGRRGYNVVVFIPSVGEINELFSNAGINVKVVSYPWWVHDGGIPFNFIERFKSFFSIFKYAIRLKQQIKNISPDVVLSNTICIPCGAMVCKFLKIRHIWFLHEVGKEDHNLLFNFGFYISCKIINYTSYKVLVNSELVKNKYKQHIDKRLLSIINYNILTPSLDRRKQTVPSKAFDLILIGQVKNSKGQKDALMALHILLRENYDVQLLIVGQVIDQNYYNDLVRIVTLNNMQESVKFINHTVSPFSEVTRFTIGLMCSEFEALGRVTIEYMKAGIPVVGANAGSTSFLIDNGKTGLLYELRNSEDLAKKIKILLNDMDLVSQMTDRARSYATANFNEKLFIDGIIDSFKF